MRSPALTLPVALLVLSALPASSCSTRSTSSTRTTPAAPGALAERYAEEAARIQKAALMSEDGWTKLAHLTDHIGHRLSGSEGLENAVAWTTKAMIEDGHENVHTEKVMVPHWTRGEEWGRVTLPLERPLHLVGLGGTIATPPEGIEADVVVVNTLDEVRALGKRAQGKIVLINKKMPAYHPERGAGYGDTVVIRRNGPVEGAKVGAVAVLIRSVTHESLQSPHTGATRYEEGVERIPAAAVSLEDADLMARWSASGTKTRVRIRLSGQWHPDAESANVVGEIVGRELPDEIVLIGAHLDSWDVGQGAHDDGTGVVIMMQALTTLRSLGLRPRRTVRVVLFTNEENGLRGARSYAHEHAQEVGRHVAAMESDGGGFKPRGFRVNGTELALAQAREISRLLEPLAATRVEPGYAGADMGPLTEQGVPGLGLWVDGSKYFNYHHTHSDTLDKVDPDHLAMNIAAVATMVYVLAEMPERFGEGPGTTGTR